MFGGIMLWEYYASNDCYFGCRHLVASLLLLFGYSQEGLKFQTTVYKLVSFKLNFSLDLLLDIGYATGI